MKMNEYDLNIHSDIRNYTLHICAHTVYLCIMNVGYIVRVSCNIFVTNVVLYARCACHHTHKFIMYFGEHYTQHIKRNMV